MDTRVASKKLGLKERYAAMTRGLGWETSYQPMDKVFPYDKYEGIKIHDWDKWQDPFRLTMDAYWKYQGEKEKKLYAVIEAFAQNNGQLGVADARYVNALKLFIQGVTPLEYYAHRGFAHVGRQFTGEGARVAGARTDAWGYYRVDGLPAGRYRVQAAGGAARDVRLGREFAFGIDLDAGTTP